MVRGIFGLDKVYKKQVQNVKNDNFESWPESATYGYFGGGFNPGLPNYVNTVDRIDFSNETTSTPGNNLPQARYGLAAVSSSSYGYFGGGSTAVPFSFYDIETTLSTVDRIDFSSETLSLPGNNLPQAKSYSATVSSSSYGYFGCGFFTPPSTHIDTITRFDLSSETFSAPGNNLPQIRSSLAAVSSDSYGYFGAGYNYPPPSGPAVYYNTVDRIDFSSETTSAPGNNLPQARSNLAAVSSSSYGYFGGGVFSPPNTYFATVDRIDFSNETTSAPGNNLPEVRSGLAACSSSSYGYFGGGFFSPPTYNPAGNLSTVDRIDFSNETTSAPGNNLPQARQRLAATSGGASERIKGSRTYGYFGGGEAPPQVTTVDRIDFSNETTSAPGNNLPQARRGLAAVSSSSYGYFGGGRNPVESPSRVDTIDRIDFSNETTSVPGNNLSQGRERLAAVSSSSYGYFGGGFSPSLVTTVDRIDFANETTSAPGNNLPQARGGVAAVSSSSYGYFGGGFAPPYVDTIDRIDFSNETTSAPGNNLPEVRYNFVALSNSSYGYFGGGFSPSYVSTIDRIDFSTEAISTPGNNLSQARDSLGACSSSSYGYFGGGKAPAYVDTVDRIDFSNETTSAPGNNLPQARQRLAATSN